MSQPMSRVIEDDRIIKAHTRRARDELEMALQIARSSVRGNPRARSVELDLARVLRLLEDVGTLVSKYPVEEPARGPSAAEKHKALRQRRAGDPAREQPLLEEND